MNATKLQCLTTANWLRGYAETLDAHNYATLIYRMNQAANLLGQVWDEYAQANGYEDIKGSEDKNET